jgi:HSP20 family protein
MGLNRWQPFGEMQSLRNWMDRMFEDSFSHPFRAFDQSWGMGGLPLDVYEESDKYVVEAALPGVRPEDVDVQVQGNTVTISGRIEQSQPEQQGQGQQGGRSYLVRERMGGQFSRSVTLPVEIDTEKCEAKFEHGVLRLTLPKTAAHQPKRIQIQGQGGQPRQIEGSSRPQGEQEKAA